MHRNLGLLFPTLSHQATIIQSLSADSRYGSYLESSDIPQEIPLLQIMKYKASSQVTAIRNVQRYCFFKKYEDICI